MNSLTIRETATVLAALRMFQKEHLSAGIRDRAAVINDIRLAFPDHFAEDVPLSDAEVDDLCERLNCPPIRSVSKLQAKPGRFYFIVNPQTSKEAVWHLIEQTVKTYAGWNQEDVANEAGPKNGSIIASEPTLDALTKHLANGMQAKTV